MRAQLTPAKADPADLVVGYRTNPHRDLPHVGFQVGRLLPRIIRGELRPTSAWRSLPIAIGGGANVDFLAPMRQIKHYLKALERDGRVLRANLFTVHPFSDSKDLGWSVHVTTDGDQALAEQLADEVADRAWAIRAEPAPRFLEPAEAIGVARRRWWARKTGCVFFSDVSDVVGAGAPGENTALLEALMRVEDMVSFVPIRDDSVVEALWDAPLGSTVDRTVGGRLDPQTNVPLRVRGHLRARADLGAFGRAVRLDLGSVQLVVTDGIPYTLRPSFYTALGLRMRDADIVVVKSFFHFMVGFAPYVRSAIPVRTRGATDLEACAQVPFTDPMFPFSEPPPAGWRAADRRRRS